MATNRTGFHYAPGGNANGIGAHFSAMDAAGIPCVLASYDNYGVCGELAAYTNAPHVIAFRPHVYPENPDYDLSPDVAGANHWARLLAAMPPEFDKNRVWVLWGNEGRKEIEWGGWWGDVAVEVASRAKAAGFKTLAFGFSAGTPEVEVWQTAGMLSYLQWCNENYGWGGLALHEGADPRYGGPEFGPLVADVPWISGRYRFAFAECDKRGWKRPPILITECAWKYNDAPGVERAMNDIADAQAFYDADGAMGFCLWSLTGPGGGGEYGRVSDKTQALIQPVTAFAIGNTTPPIILPPDPEGAPVSDLSPLEEHLRVTAAERPHFNDDAALQKAINATPGLRTLTLEGRTNFEGRQYAFQEACDEYDTQRTLFYCLVNDWGNIKTVVYPGANPPPPPAPVFPIEQLYVGRPLETWVLTSVYGTPRDYDGDGIKGDKHEGIDLAAATGTPIHAVEGGKVVKVAYSPTGWGNYTKIEHEFKGFVWASTYAHMNTPSPLVVGKVVAKGEVVGSVGSTGNSTGAHLHLTFQVPGYGDNGGGFPTSVPDCVNPYPRIDFVTPNVAAGGGIGDAYDLSLYLRGKKAVTLRNLQGQQEHVYYPDIPGVPGGWYIAKNALYEELRVTATAIERRVDTSPGNDESYCQFVDDGEPWAVWARRFMRVGESIDRYPLVIFKSNGNCNQTKTYRDPSALKLNAHYDKWTDPTTGTVFSDVVELHWLKGSAVVEKYFAARDVGYIRFEVPGGYTSWIHETLASNTGDPVRPSPCWNF